MKSKSELFLMELIIVILFFSLSAAVCLQLFVKAHTLDEKTVEQYNTVVWCQNLAELYTEYDGDVNAMSMPLSEYMPYITGSVMSIALDKEWEPFDGREGDFNIILTSSSLDEEKGLIRANIEVQSGNTLLYSTQITHHIQKRLGE